MHGQLYIHLKIVYSKTCAFTSHDVLSRPWFLPLILFQAIWFFGMFYSQRSASWIRFNFDSSCSFFKVTEDNLRSTFLSATLYTQLNNEFPIIPTANYPLVTPPEKKQRFLSWPGVLWQFPANLIYTVRFSLNN